MNDCLAGKRFLFIPYGHALSHVTRLLEIAKELRRRGADCHFGGGGKYLIFPERSGFPLHRLEEMDHAEVMAKLESLDFTDNPARIERFVLEEIQLYERLKPDMVISDTRVTANISATIAGVPQSAVVNAAWTSWYDPRAVKVFQTDFVRKKIIEPMLPVLLPLFRPLAARLIAAPFNKVLRKYRKPTISHVNLGNVYTFIADVPLFAPLVRQPEKLLYVGPLIWSGEGSEKVELPKLDASKRTVYITWGSTGPDNLARFYSQCANLFGGGQFNVLVSTGGQLPRDRWPEFPPNFFVEEYLPGEEVMKRCHAVVCHSGSGTIYQAFRAGVPVVALPVNNEQRMHGHRIQALGLGEVVDYKALGGSLAPLENALTNVLERPQYAECARKMAEEIGRWNAPERAAGYLAQYFEKR